jgi:hypothetical protein
MGALLELGIQDLTFSPDPVGRAKETVRGSSSIADTPRPGGSDTGSPEPAGPALMNRTSDREWGAEIDLGRHPRRAPPLKQQGFRSGASHPRTTCPSDWSVRVTRGTAAVRDSRPAARRARRQLERVRGQDLTVPDVYEAVSRHAGDLTCSIGASKTAHESGCAQVISGEWITAFRGRVRPRRTRRCRRCRLLSHSASAPPTSAFDALGARSSVVDSRRGRDTAMRLSRMADRHPSRPVSSIADPGRSDCWSSTPS